MTIPVTLKFLRVGKCSHLECMAERSGRLTLIDFPSCCGLIKHPTEGWILFDTGYADHFFSATQGLPEKLYRIALPVELKPEEKLVQQLARLNIKPEEIRWVIVSHYHGDHISGLRDFPNAKFIASRKDTDAFVKLMKRPWLSTLEGKLPALLPKNYFDRLSFVEDLKKINLPNWMQPFSEGFDLFGDRSLVIIPLPGHSNGQIGLLTPNADGRPVFLTADACWSLPACQAGILPSSFTKFLTENNKQYRETFFQLNEIANREANLSILPSHCLKSWESFNEQ